MARRSTQMKTPEASPRRPWRGELATLAPGASLEGAPEAAPVDTMAPTHGRSLDAGAVLGLQRAVGNRSTQQLVQRTSVQRDAESDRVQKLDDDYEKALAQSDWTTAAERLNAFNREDILARLGKINRGQRASLYVGARDNPKVGPDAQVAELTRPAYLDVNYENEMKKGSWGEAAKYLNGFNDPDIAQRVQKLSPADRQALRQGAAPYDRIVKAIDAAPAPAPAQIGGEPHGDAGGKATAPHVTDTPGQQGSQAPAPGAGSAAPGTAALKRPNGLQELIAVFGQPGTNLGMHEMRCGPGGALTKVYCHNKIAPLLKQVFDNIYSDGKSHLIHFFAGCYNDRTVGGATKKSTHAWGIAVDLNPEGNARVPSSTPADKVPVSEDQKALAPYFEAQGFIWGRAFGDSMHFQYCTGY